MNIDKNTIEYLADKIINDYRVKGKIDWQIFSVDPIILAKMYGYKVNFEKLGTDELLGFTGFSKSIVTVEMDKFYKDIHLDGKTIVVNSILLNCSRGEINKVIAILFSHHILRSLRPEKYDKKYGVLPVFLEKNTVGDSLEWTVSLLATNILMPTEFLEIVFIKTFKTGFMPVLNSALHKDNYVKFCAIADLFGVTKRDLCVRLQSEGLLGDFQYCGFEKILSIRPDLEECRTA